MHVVILAREKSERFARKHLYPINGVPMIWSMVQRLIKAGAQVTLATGTKANNHSLGMVCAQAGAVVYHEENAPEWDLPSRMIGMAKFRGIDRWVLLSGDCVFFDTRAVKLVWDALVATQADRVGLVLPYAAAGVGMGDRLMGGDTLAFWKMMDGSLVDTDLRREAPWSYVTGYTTENVEIPWVDIAKTPVKSSIDWPFEAAIADYIVRFLGRYPESDKDIERVYSQAITIAPEVNNWPNVNEKMDHLTSVLRPLGEDDLSCKEKL